MCKHLTLQYLLHLTSNDTGVLGLGLELERVICKTHGSSVPG